MYDRLLLPTDMSPGVDQATAHAIDAAQRYDAALHVLYVVDSDAYSSYPGDEYVHEFEGLEAALEQAGADAIAAIVEQAADAGVEIESTIRHGVPHEEILAYVDDAGIDLTIMGSKHRAGEYRSLLGSVAERVVTMADGPVTVVKTPVDDD